MEAPEKKRSTDSFRKRQSVLSPKNGRAEEGESFNLPVTTEEQEDASISEFDPINLRDRVVIKLLFDQVVRIEQVQSAWEKWRECVLRVTGFRFLAYSVSRLRLVSSFWLNDPNSKPKTGNPKPET